MKQRIWICVFFITLPIFSLVQTGLCQYQWSTVFTIDDAHDLIALDFIDSNSGIVTGYNTFIITTSDGGKTWSQSVTTIPPSPFRGVKYAAKNIAIAVSHDGKIIRTSDNGSTWQQIVAPKLQYWAITFNKIGIGLAVGDSGEIARSTDFGMTWDSIPRISKARLTAVTFPDDSVAIIVADDGSIWRSGTSGQSWTEILNLTTTGLSSVSFSDRYHGYAIGNQVIKTSDGGYTWASANTPIAYGNTIFCHSPNSITLGSGSDIYFTSDAGQTWSTYHDSSSIIGLNFPDSAHGFAITTSEVLTKLTDTKSGIKENFQNSNIQSFPNPVSDHVTIEYSLPEASLIKLSLFNLLGVKRSEFFTGRVEGGLHSFEFEPSNISSGTYFLVLEYNKKILINTITVIH